MNCLSPSTDADRSPTLMSLNTAGATWLQHRTEEGPSDGHSLTPRLSLSHEDRIRLEKFPCIPEQDITKAEVRSE